MSKQDKTTTKAAGDASAELIEIVETWQKWLGRVKQAKEFELELRNRLVSENFDSLTEGSNVVRYEDANVRLTAKQPMYRKVDADKLTECYSKAVEVLGEDVAKYWFSMLFEYKPTLNLKNYRQLQTSTDPTTKELFKIVSDCITTSEGTPSLTYLPIK